MSVDNIKVSIKIRPLIAREKNDEASKEWYVDEDNLLKSVSRGHAFSFDHIFDESTTNQQVFEQIAKPIITNALNGINGTIFAYGQTSSGKTYCMSGTEEEPGIVPLTVHEIFDQINSKMADREFLIRVGYIEIYNEKIFDLLDLSKPEVVRIFEPAQGEVKISQMELMASSAEVMLEHFIKGNDTKRTGETAMNERSSRSHAIFSITIESRDKDSSNNGECRVSTLNLVDLAGSERADQTKATGERLNESKHINQSLLALGKVIRELSAMSNDIGQFVSYRDSKLTRLLSASLGGNAKTAIVCTITPATIDETLSTLNFANNAKTIKNKPKVNSVLSEKAIMNRLKKQIELLKNQLKEEKSRNAELESIKQLKHQIQERESQIIHGDNSNLLKVKDINRRRTWMCPSTNEEQISPQISPQLTAPGAQLPPFILRNTEDGPLITFTYDDELTDEIFKSPTEVDFSEPIVNLMVNDEELARRLHTPRSFKKFITLPESPEIKMPSEMSKDEEIHKLKMENDHLRDELRELAEFKKMEDLFDSERKNQANAEELSELEEKIAVLESVINQKDEEILSLKELETKMQLSDNELRKAVKERQEKENILASIHYEYDQYKLKAKLREDELVQELNEARDTQKLKEKIKSLEECLKTTEQDLFNLQSAKSASDGNQMQLTELEGKIKDLEHQLEIEKKSRLNAEKDLKEYEATSDQLIEALEENEKLQKDIDEIKEVLSEKVLKIQELQDKTNESDAIVVQFKTIQEILQNNQDTQEDNNDINKTLIRLIQSASRTESLEVEKLSLIKEIEEIRSTAMELTEKLTANQTLTETESNYREKIESLVEQVEKCTFKIQEYEDKLSEQALKLIETVASKTALQSELETLNANVATLQDQVSSFEKSRKELIIKLQQAQIDIELKQQEISNLINNGATRQREYEISEKEKASDNTIIDLTIQLEKMQLIIDSQNKDHKDMTVRSKRMEAELDASRTTTYNLREKLKEMESKIKLPELSHKETSTDLDDDSEHTELLDNLEIIQHKYDSLVIVNDDLQKTVNELSEKCVTLKSELDVSTQKLKITEDMVEVNQEKITTLERICVQHLEAINAKNQQIENDEMQYSVQLNNLQSELDAEGAIRCDLEKTVTELSEKCVTLNTEIQENVQQIESSQQKLQQLEAANAKLLAEIEAFTNNKEGSDTEKSDLQTELEKISSELSENAEKLKAYEGEIQDLMTKNENLMMVIDQKNALLSDLEPQIEEITNKCSRLESEVKSKTTEYDELKAQYRRRSQENDGKLQDLEVANNKLMQNVGAVEAEKIVLQTDIKKLQEKHAKVISEQLSQVILSDAQHKQETEKLKCDVNRYQRDCDEMKKQTKIINESLAQQTTENFAHLQTIAELKSAYEKLTNEFDLLKKQPPKKSSPIIQNRRSGESIEDEAFALQRKQLQIESNHGTPVRAMKSNLNRKTRRQSVYAENRRLSDWELTNTVEIQTDNVDVMCACKEYAEKIRLLEIEVRKKQVIINNAERMAKCNPLKVDLAELKIKYDREQAANKRLKSSLENLEEELATFKKQKNGIMQSLDGDLQYVTKSEYEKLLNEKISIERKLQETKRQLKHSSEKENVGVNTSLNNLQNNEEMAALKDEHDTLLRKYDMAKRLCNLRLDDLKKLRDEVSSKDELMLETQREIERMTNKYEEAKRVCLIRMEKITALRERLGETGENHEQN